MDLKLYAAASLRSIETRQVVQPCTLLTESFGHSIYRNNKSSVMSGTYFISLIIVFAFAQVEATSRNLAVSNTPEFAYDNVVETSIQS